MLKVQQMRIAADAAGIIGGTGCHMAVALKVPCFYGANEETDL